MVTASILLLVALGMANITLKQQTLFSSASDSLQALYAADSGVNCATYLIKKNLLSSHTATNGTGATLPAITSVAQYCTVDVSGDPGTITPDPNNPAVSLFKLGVVGGVGGCAIVSIDKTSTTINGITYSFHIRSHGYNTCDATSNRLERGVEAYL